MDIVHMVNILRSKNTACILQLQICTNFDSYGNNMVIPLCMGLQSNLNVLYPYTLEGWAIQVIVENDLFRTKQALSQKSHFWKATSIIYFDMWTFYVLFEKKTKSITYFVMW